MKKRYVIAIKREERANVPADWSAALGRIDGLTILGSDDPVRVQVEATDEAIAEARRVLGDRFYIEPVILHRPL